MPKYRPSYYEFGGSPLLGDEAEFEGDEVGVVVVAVNEEVCKQALDAVKVEWEVLPFILDPREAAKPGAPILRPEMNPDSNMTGNTFGAAVEWELGCVEDGFKEADHIEVIDYGRPMWSQFRPMPPAYFSYWADDAWGNPDGEKMCYVTNHAHFPGNGPIVSAYYGAGSYADKYRALSPYMAARYCDFVEKRGAQFAPVLSKRLGGVPVRYVQSRRESFDAAVPQTYLTMRIGFKDDGTLVAVQSENIHQTGARGGYGDKTHGHLVLPPNAQGFKQTVSPNVYSTMGYYVTNGACTTADPGQPMYEPVNLAFAKMADVLGLDVTADEVDLVDSLITLKADPTKQMPISGMGQLAVGYCGKPKVPFQTDVIRTMNVDMCEVAVDPETGLVEILDYVVAHDFGKVIRPSSALGQIENAITMNSGRALREELIWDEATGVLLNGNMYDYKVPTILDQPKIEPVPVETRCGGGAYGSTGVAHAHANPGLVGQAIQNATGGDFIDMVPYTPDKVLAVLGKIAQ